MDPRKSLYASAILVAMSPPAFATKNWNEHQIIHKCERWVVGDEVNLAWIRGQPNLQGTPLWKLTSGTVMVWCGNASTDRSGIDWYWIEFKSTQEPWPHGGWISSRIITPGSRRAVEYTADCPGTIAAARARTATKGSSAGRA